MAVLYELAEEYENTAKKLRKRGREIRQEKPHLSAQLYKIAKDADKIAYLLRHYYEKGCPSYEQLTEVNSYGLKELKKPAALRRREHPGKRKADHRAESRLPSPSNQNATALNTTPTRDVFDVLFGWPLGNGNRKKAGSK